MPTQAQRRAERRDERITGENGRLYAPRAPKHGTWSALTYWFCQCDECAAFEAAERVRRAADRAHNEAILRQLQATATEARKAPIAPDLPGERALVAQRTEPRFPKAEAAGSSPAEGTPDVHATFTHVDGRPIPRFSAAARRALISVEQLRRVATCFYDPEITATTETGSRRHVGAGLVLLISTDDVVLSVVERDPVEVERNARVIPIQSASAAPRRTGKGPSGSRNPTTWKELHERLRAMGAEVYPGSGGHVKVRLPDGRTTSMPSTASDHRSLPNQVMQLRRLGYDTRRAN